MNFVWPWVLTSHTNSVANIAPHSHANVIFEFSQPPIPSSSGSRYLTLLAHWKFLIRNFGSLTWLPTVSKFSADMLELIFPTAQNKIRLFCRVCHLFISPLVYFTSNCERSLSHFHHFFFNCFDLTSAQSLLCALEPRHVKPRHFLNCELESTSHFIVSGLDRVVTPSPCTNPFIRVSLPPLSSHIPSPVFQTYLH
jgi:hypothetical protein